jgi:hypothetical protein
MVIEHINSFVKNYNIDPPVTVNGSTVAVAECSITHNGQIISLPAFSFELKTLPHRATYCLYAVRSRADNAVDWLFDECVEDGVDQSYQIQGSPFDLLHWAIYATVPPNTTDFKDQKVLVFRIFDPDQQAQQATE